MKRRFSLGFSSLVLVILAAVVIWSPGGASALLPDHNCNFCHRIHGASGFVLLDNPEIEALCLSCHGPTGPSVLKVDVHTNDNNSPFPPFRITCRECHDPHDSRLNWLGGLNLKAVGVDADGTGLAKIDTPVSGIRDVVFESRGTTADPAEPSLHSFADADEDENGIYDGICEVCHTATRQHRNDGSANTRHNTGKTCTNCHEHVTTFNP